MFKEIVFELAGGRPRTAHARYFFEHPELAARMQILHATPDMTWELITVTGESADVRAFEAEIARGPVPPMVDLEIVSATPRTLQYVVKWARPTNDEAGTSLEFMLYDHVGPDALFNMRIESGRAEVKVAGPDGEKLLRYFNAVRGRLENRYQVRLVRVGELRPGWEEARETRSTIRDEDRQLVAFALAAGYYDNPKRCGVRELGDALGWSKSVVARKLRAIERRALENIVTPPTRDAPEAVTHLAPVSPHARLA